MEEVVVLLGEIRDALQLLVELQSAMIDAIHSDDEDEPAFDLDGNPNPRNREDDEPL